VSNKKYILFRFSADRWLYEKFCPNFNGPGLKKVNIRNKTRKLRFELGENDTTDSVRKYWRDQVDRQYEHGEP